MRMTREGGDGVGLEGVGWGFGDVCDVMVTRFGSLGGGGGTVAVKVQMGKVCNS